MDKPQDPNTPIEGTNQIPEEKNEPIEEQPVKDEPAVDQKPAESAEPPETMQDKTPTMPKDEKPTGAVKKSSNTLIIIALVFFILVLLAAVLFGVWYFVIRDDKSKSKSNDTNTNTPCIYNAELVTDTAIVGSDDISAEEAFTKKWTVKNTGTCEWKGNVKLVFVSGDTIGEDETIAITNTAVNATTEISIDLTAPSEAGTYQSIWKLKVNDGNEFGDALPLTVVVKGVTVTDAPADLIITQLQVGTAQIRQGVPFTITAKIKNQGGQNAVGFKTAWKACNSDACPYIDFPGTTTLTAGEETTIQMEYTYTTWSTYTSSAKVDTTNKVTESNENNNVRSLVIPVLEGQSDLIVESITYNPTTPISGEVTTISIVYKNIGHKAVTQNVSLQWWQSPSAPNPNCTIVVNNIGVGESKTATCTYTFPSWYPTITTRATIDLGNLETESDETNNTLTKAITVSAP